MQKIDLSDLEMAQLREQLGRLPEPHGGRRQLHPLPNVINLRPNSLFCRKISSFHHHLKESEMNSVPAVPTTDQAVLPKII